MKKFVLLSITLVIVVSMIGYSAVGSDSQSATCLACTGDGSVVDKVPGEAFIVEVSFKNTGGTGGNWSVNIVFEGEKWTWTGVSQNLTLMAFSTKTLVWKGNVPVSATVDSITRLVVYYGDSFTPLNWWIRIVPKAELTVTSSTVK